MAGLSLLQRKFEDVFRGILKLTDNAPVNGILRTVTDGEGNDTALQVSSSAVNVAGALSATSLGYVAGQGGSVTQLSSKATAVTVNTICGAITMHNAALGAGSIVTFIVNNSQFAATDIVVLNVRGGIAANTYNAWIGSVAAGFFYINLQNTSAGSLSEAVLIGFAIIKSVNT